MNLESKPNIHFRKILLSHRIFRLARRNIIYIGYSPQLTHNDLSWYTRLPSQQAHASQLSVQRAKPSGQHNPLLFITDICHFPAKTAWPSWASIQSYGAGVRYPVYKHRSFLSRVTKHYPNSWFSNLWFASWRVLLSSTLPSLRVLDLCFTTLSPQFSKYSEIFRNISSVSLLSLTPEASS